VTSTPIIEKRSFVKQFGRFISPVPGDSLMVYEETTGTLF
jgi:hypothetical protein